MKVTLTMKPVGGSFIPIEAESIIPKSFLSGTDDISVWRGNRELGLSEVFSISVEGKADRPEDVEVIIAGDETFRLKGWARTWTAAKSPSSVISGCIAAIL